MTASELLTGLLSLLGAGGVTTIVVGFLAYKREALQGRREGSPSGRRDPLAPDSLPTTGAFPGSHDFELLANAVTQLAAAVQQQALVLEFYVVERGSTHEAFRTWLDAREMEQTLAAFKAEHAKKPR